MTIKTTKTYEQEVQILVPSFWVNPTTAFREYTAILNEDTVVSFTSFTDGLLMFDFKASDHISKKKIQEAFDRFHPCTEEEFFEEYQKAYQSLNLSPVTI